jgi:hypothetical protein
VVREDGHHFIPEYRWVGGQAPAESVGEFSFFNFGSSHLRRISFCCIFWACVPLKIVNTAQPFFSRTR